MMKKLLTVLGVLAVTAVLAAVAAYAYGAYEYGASFGSAPQSVRIAEARRAAAADPWNVRYRVRPDWILGEAQFKAGDPIKAYFTLRHAIDADPWNPGLRRLWFQVYPAYYAATTWKAHVQHQHELPGGILPEDRVVH